MHSFSSRLLSWFEQNGRKDLPWQQQLTPYRVWVSEIMLQQTQVKTVIPYFQRFMRSFPDITSLAQAELDQVLHHWSGLGYYARGRNLHKTAKLVCHEFAGEFPEDIESIMDLPGIGRSTAGAILSLACNQRQPILDGNVKRVLCRHRAIEGWPGASATQKILWSVAEELTPTKNVAAYTQSIMDLGATVCTRSRPQCGSCPVEVDCAARAQGRVSEFPFSKKRKPLPVKHSIMLMLRNEQQALLLLKRPPVGIWGGLWSFPEAPLDVELVDWCENELGLRISVEQVHPVIRHTFSHFHLDIKPIQGTANSIMNRVLEPGATVWYNTGQPEALGLAAPVQKLMNMLV